jgi:sorbose reductase
VISGYDSIDIDLTIQSGHICLDGHARNFGVVKPSLLLIFPTSSSIQCPKGWSEDVLIPQALTIYLLPRYHNLYQTSEAGNHSTNTMSMTIEECLTRRRGRPLPDIPNDVLAQFDMTGKVCMVTGSSRGIGCAVAQGLAEAGAHIVNVYSSESADMDKRAAAMAKRYGVKVLNRRCNVANADEVENMISDIKKELGRIDVFIANAGVCIPKTIFEQTLDEYHAQMNVNVHGVFYCAKYVGLVFKEQGCGNFIITSSISGQVVTVPVDHITYNTTKAAVTHLGRSLAREWRDFARVNMVSPGYIDTDMSNCPATINEAHRMAVLGRQGKNFLSSVCTTY